MASQLPALCAAYTPLFNPIATSFIALGIIAAIVMTVRWGTGTAVRRRRTSKLLDPKQPLAFLTPSGSEEELRHSAQLDLPGVTFVMPVKMTSIKSASPKDNWRSQINTMYAGDTEAIFTVESEDDGAIAVVRELQQECEGGAERVKYTVAGLSTTCSQKIHNMVAAARAASPRSKYILFLDANCRLHPGTVYAMVQELEQDQKAYVATGYPFDVPPKGASLWCYTVAQVQATAPSTALAHPLPLPRPLPFSTWRRSSGGRR